jgi:hypothetical protein
MRQIYPLARSNHQHIVYIPFAIGLRADATGNLKRQFDTRGHVVSFMAEQARTVGANANRVPKLHSLPAWFDLTSIQAIGQVLGAPLLELLQAAAGEARRFWRKGKR